MMSEEQIISEIKGLVINKKRFYGFSISVHEYEEDQVDLLESYTFLDLEETISRLFDLSIMGYDIEYIMVRSRTSVISKSRISTLYITLLKNDDMKTNINNDVIEIFQGLAMKEIY